MSGAGPFAVGAVGLWLLVVRPVPPALARLVETVSRAPSGPGEADPLERLGRWAARFEWGDWLRRRGAQQDLDLIGRSPEAHLGFKLASAALGLALPVAVTAALAVVGVDVAPVVPAWLALVLGGVGFFLPDVQRAGAAAQERREARLAVEDFAGMTAYGLRAGSNVATALDRAARRLGGRFGDELVRVLAEARFAGESPWAALDELGARFGVPDLCEVAAAVQQASKEGASVAASLEDKAVGLAHRALAECEAAAAPATLRMLVRSIVLALCALALLYGPLLLGVRRP